MMQDSANSSVYELLLEAGKQITSEVELEKLVQRITDIGTQLSGAQFGAFFYNQVNAQGEVYHLYTISGVPKEAFSKFPMPRNTAVFHPTFAGTHTVRFDDVMEQPHYGQMAPHFGMPKGHLPVRSYLAVPVIAPDTKDVIGGLFFGHESPGIFTERSEKIIEGVAAQAAIAMANAKLFEEKKKAEAFLKEQREQYKRIFHSTNDAIIICDSAGSVVDANTAASELLGYHYDDFKNFTISDLFEKPEELMATITSFTDAGRHFKGFSQIKRKSGASEEVRISVSSYLHGSRTQLVFVIRRIEAFKNIEEALVRTETFAQTITNISPVTLWMTNDKAETIYINQTWLEIVGGRLEDHLGIGWLNMIVADDRETAQQKFMDAFDQRKVFTHDFRIQAQDGSVRWCSTYGSPYYQNDGSFGGFAGSLIDITRRKLAEQQIASQNSLINTITNNTFHALFLMDDQQRCTYMNPAAEEMTGFRLHEVQEKPLHYYIHHTHPDGKHFPIDDCPIDRALPTRMQTTGEETFIRKNGEFFTVAFVASPIIEDGKPVGTVIEVRETAEEKRIQRELRDKEKQAMMMLEQKVKERTAELEKKNYELMQFTSIASHDLKEPVRKVSIFSQRAKELAANLDNHQLHQYLDSITRSSKRMITLIDDLLSFARLSDEKEQFKPVDLNILLDQIRDDLQLVIADKNATIIVDHLPVVKGIELQLGQVFQNLISNSIKFAHPDREPVITIKCTHSDGKYTIIYSDNGIGFDDKWAGRIFNIFERLHSREYEGTGIGLAIVKKIINLHDGEISAHGTPGEGARFEFSLPKTTQV